MLSRLRLLPANASEVRYCNMFALSNFNRVPLQPYTPELTTPHTLWVAAFSVSSSRLLSHSYFHCLVLLLSCCYFYVSLVCADHS